MLQKRHSVKAGHLPYQLWFVRGQAAAQAGSLERHRAEDAHPLGVEEVVGARGDDDLGLLLQGEVFPCEIRVHVRLVQLKDLVVADGTRVGVVHDTGQSPLGLQHTTQ